MNMNTNVNMNMKRSLYILPLLALFLLPTSLFSQIQVLKSGGNAGNTYNIANSPDNVTTAQLSGATISVSNKLFYTAGLYSSLQLAIIAAGNDTSVLVVDHGRYSIAQAARDTISSTVTLRVGQGSGMSVTRKLTIYGHVEDPGPVQWLFGNTDSIEFLPGSVDFVRPEWFGATVNNTSNDDGIALNRAINSGWNFANPIVVELISGEYNISTSIVLKNLVWLKGAANGATTIKLKNGSNTDIITTEDFASLTGTTTWIVDRAAPVDSMIYGFKLTDIRLDGNKANNTIGSGIKVFAKGFYIGNVKILNCPEYGIYSEGGSNTGQNSDYDMPETYVNSIWVWECDSTGIYWKGPHDARADNLFVSTCGGWGIYTETAGNHAATLDLGFAHSYSNNSGGFLVKGPLKAEYIQVESNFEEGIRIENAEVQIGILHAYNNGRTGSTGNYSVELNAGTTTIASIFVRDENAIGGIRVDGVNCAVYGNLVGYSGNNCGIYVNANRFKFGGDIDGFDKQGIYYNNASYGHISANIAGCDTAIYYPGAGVNNFFNLTVYAEAGDTSFVGSPDSTDYIILQTNNANTSGIFGVLPFNSSPGSNEYKVKKIKKSAQGNFISFDVASDVGYERSVQFFRYTNGDSLNSHLTVHAGNGKYDPVIFLDADGSIRLNQNSLLTAGLQVGSAGTKIWKMVKIGTQLAFISTAADTFYTSAAKDSTSF